MLRFSMPGGRRATAGLAAVTLAVGLATPLTAAASTSASSSAPAASSSSSLTALQALAQAHRSGEAVPVPGATTAVSTLTADPDGTMSLSESPIPVRKKVGSSWESLDATLVRNADGSISPQLSTDALTLSGGGAGPLASMTSGVDHLAITLPANLSSPTLSGDTATYANVAAGIDLVVTANTLGGFSDTFVVHDAAAADSSALTALLHATVSGAGLSVSAAGGAIAAHDKAGRTVFASNTPVMWDSSTSAPLSATRALTPSEASGTVGTTPLASTAIAPGARAHVGALTPSLSGDTLTLTPDAAVLHGAAALYPEYIDPTWNPVATTTEGWATVAEQYPTQTYWNNTADGQGYMAVGDGVADDPLLARSLVNFPLPASTLAGSTISSAVLSATDEYSGACPNGAEDEQMDVDAPSATLTSGNADWNSWDTSGDVGPTIGDKSFAYGYSSSCSSDGSPSSVSIGLSTSTFSNDVASGKQTQTLALVADDESSEYSWKEFIYSTAQLTITYDMTPSITKADTGSVGCGTASDPGVVGKGDVELLAGVYQRNGSSLTADFRLYNSAKTTEYNPTSTTGATTSSPSALAATSGTNATLTLQSTFFNGFSTTTSTTFAWTVAATDGTLTSPTDTCYFTYNPTSPGEPALLDSTGAACDSSALSYTVGTPASFTADANSAGATPTTYYYQLNGAAPISVPATGGDATFTLKPTSGSDILSIDADNSAGNIGTAAVCYFQAAAPAPAADHDLSGDGTPDLLTAGTGSGTMPSGLWLAEGTKSGAVAATPAAIGVNGDGLVDDPADYNGAQVISGQFTGNGFNDVLAYYPSGTTLNGTTKPLTGAQGMIVTGTGDGSALQAEQSENVHTATYAALQDNNGAYPTLIANAYHADTSNTNTTYPDLVGIAGSSTLSYLDYYPSDTTIGGYSTNSLSNALTIAMNTPDSTPDWYEWSIATAEVGNALDMYLWNESTGALYLWSGVTVVDNGDNSGTLTYANSYPLYDGSTGHTWNKGVALHTLEAADIAGNGTPDLWTVDGSGNATAYMVSGLSTTANTTTVTAETPQTLEMATHDWSLGDYDSATNNTDTAHDNATTGPLTLTGSGSVSAHTGDLFSPDVDFTGSSAQLAATSPALDLTKSFTISLWAKPMAYGMMPISQDGTVYPGMMLDPTPSGWTFYLAKDNGAGSWDGDSIVGGSAQLGSWAHLQATYDASTGVMNLYVDNTFVATGSHTAPTTGATGDFRLGSNIDNGTQTSFYSGQIAGVQTWSGQALAPNQPYTPASYHQAVVPERLLDTRSTTGDNLTSGTTAASTPVASDATATLQIVGDGVTPTVSGAPTAIPASATAVAIDVTAVSQTSVGNLITYADGTQRPITSATNWPSASNTVTGYQIVPIGLDGKIAIYNESTGTTHLLVDLTGYYTSDATLTGDQTYHPLTAAQRILDTATSTAHTNLQGTGPVAAGSTFTLTATGFDGIPSTATAPVTALAINLTAFDQSGGGIIEAYEDGTTEPTDTTLTYSSSQTASMVADVNLSSAGKIDINNIGSNKTDVIGDVSGYFTTDMTGEAYHTVNPTRLVDTRSGIGGTTGALAASGVYTISGGDTQQITTEPNPTLALMLTATEETEAGDAVAYPTGATVPGTSNLNWTAGRNIANVSLTPTDSTGAVSITNQSTGTTQLIVDCSGYFAQS